MAGRILPARRPRKPPQQRRLSATPAPAPTPAKASTASIWRPGDKVLWNGFTGTFLRETIDDYVEVLIGTQTYRVHKAELRLA
jgi:hypothetical protein